MTLPFIRRGWVVLIILAAAAGVAPAQAQRYDGDGVVRVGLFAQGVWLDANQTLPASTGTTLDGVTGGMSAGYDFWRSNRFVLGFEADAAFGDLSGNLGTVSFGYDYLATLRGRVGFYVHPNWLIYATGGAAWLGFEAQSTLTGDKASATLTGWAAGGGTEIDWRSVILFAEYLHTDFGSINYTVDATQQRAEVEGDVVRVGIKFKVGHDYFHDDLRPLK